MRHSRVWQLGQDVTEYIIIVALLAIAAIAVYGLFGDTPRGQADASDDEVTARHSVRVMAPGATPATPLAEHSKPR